MRPLTAILANAMTLRREWLAAMLEPRRDIDKECQYPSSLGAADYRSLFDRADIANRIVRIFPEATWEQPPLVYETEEEKGTEFEEEWASLTQRLPVFAALERADVLSGIGRFGILLLGVDDGEDLSAPLPGFDSEEPRGGRKTRELLYLRPLDETVTSITAWETRLTSPRYGLPSMYSVRFENDSGVGKTVLVHWSRVIHLADNRINSDVYGTPRLQPVVNRLLDLKKLAGGSAEMFWKGGFPGLSLETHPQLGTDIEFDKEQTKEEVLAYMEGLQRYIATVGMSVKSLTSQVADPSPHVEVQLKLIGASIGIPWRILFGSEAAELASTQDVATWRRRVWHRQQSYASPYVLSPLVNRLISVGVLPLPPEGYIIEWPDPFVLGEKEQAEVAEITARALASYIQSGAETLIPPFYFLTSILKMTDDEARAILQQAAEEAEEELGITEG